MAKGFLRSFARVATMGEALDVARDLLAALDGAATVMSLLVEPYYKEDGWIEVTPRFSDFDIEAVKARLAADWVEGGEGWIWNPEAHWNQGEGASFAVPKIVWALVETID
ncbi:MAG: hypothetical protein GC145_15875 [Caulobacter sp.]|nr:hypothetical protein [Caulobacter sp.]